MSGKEVGLATCWKGSERWHSCIFGCGQMQGRGVGWEMGSREADLSAAPLTRERSASVEMTVFGLDRTGTDNGKATAKAGLGLVDGLHPTHRRVRDGWGTRAVSVGGRRAGKGRCKGAVLAGK